MSFRRRHGNPDRNQPALVDEARKMGLDIVITTGVGGDFVDLVVGAFGMTVLAEVKRPKKKLADGQIAFRDRWRGGPVIRVENSQQLMDYLTQLHQRHCPWCGRGKPV